jgi:MTH538 TIR-like domain (DUF1863)
MGVVSEPDGFDAFISYSHAADGQLTPAVRLGMQAVGKKWNRRRASRIFCDQSSLSATPELWPTIEQALSASRFLVLLASPQAAASVWVRQELDWWRSHGSPSTVLIGLTDGELVWDESRQRFDPVRTTALPPNALNWFAREPLWVDLRWAREARHLSLRDPRFRDCMAGLVAPVRGVPKDALIGEDIRQHRRSMRLLTGGVTLLALLAALSLVAALLAVQRGNTALARQVAAAAVSNTTQRLDLSMLLASEAYREEPTAQSTAALFPGGHSESASGAVRGQQDPGDRPRLGAGRNHRGDRRCGWDGAGLGPDGRAGADCDRRPTPAGDFGRGQR